MDLQAGLLILDPEIGTADYADSKDGQTLAGDCDLTCRVNGGGKTTGHKFLNPRNPRNLRFIPSAF